MMFGHRCACRRDDLLHAGLMTAHDIEVAFDDDDIVVFAYSFFCLREAKDVTTFVIDRCLWRVKVFWRILDILDDAARKANHLPTRVHQRHAHTPTEHITAITIGESGVRDFFFRKTFFAQIADQCITAIRRIPDSKFFDDIPRQSSFLENILESMLISQQAMLVVVCCHRISLDCSLLLVCNLLCTLSLVLRELDACLTRQMLQRRSKIHSFDFHDEREDIPSFVGAKIMPNILVRAYEKTRRFFTAKRTKPLKVPSGTLELDVLTDNVLNIQSRPYLLFGILHISSIPLYGQDFTCFA